MDPDEALARYLQNQDKVEMEAIEADLTLAKQLQNEAFNVQNTFSSRFFLSDYALALQLEKEEKNSFAALQHDAELAKHLLDTVDESIMDEENPDIHRLFYYFNKKYFNDLLSSVEVKWSAKMTRCAGTCTYKANGECIVAMSEPLLKFRTKIEMMETLLHEMIHALSFLTQRYTLEDDGHGPEYLREMDRINRATGFNITVFHDFHDEVEHYQKHVWKCDGVCRNVAPYFGLVKRAVNRPPQPADTWYDAHQRECGGTYTKISSPPAKRKAVENNTLDKYFAVTNSKKRK